VKNIGAHGSTQRSSQSPETDSCCDTQHRSVASLEQCINRLPKPCANTGDKCDLEYWNEVFASLSQHLLSFIRNSELDRSRLTKILLVNLTELDFGTDIYQRSVVYTVECMSISGRGNAWFPRNYRELQLVIFWVASPNEKPTIRLSIPDVSICIYCCSVLERDYIGSIDR
jgi:hypothetical protein